MFKLRFSHQKPGLRPPAQAFRIYELGLKPPKACTVGLAWPSSGFEAGAGTPLVDEGRDVNDKVEISPLLNCSDTQISQEEEARAESSKKCHRVSASPSHPKKKKKSWFYQPSAPLQDCLSLLSGSEPVAPPTPAIAVKLQEYPILSGWKRWEQKSG